MRLRTQARVMRALPPNTAGSGVFQHCPVSVAITTGKPTRLSRSGGDRVPLQRARRVRVNQPTDCPRSDLIYDARRRMECAAPPSWMQIHRLDETKCALPSIRERLVPCAGPRTTLQFIGIRAALFVILGVPVTRRCRVCRCIARVMTLREGCAHVLFP